MKRWWIPAGVGFLLGVAALAAASVWALNGVTVWAED